MPKKKLTKSQVKTKMIKAGFLIGDLASDKIYQADSLVPMSSKKLLEIIETMQRAFKRVK
jgi:hypothetical protein